MKQVLTVDFQQPWNSSQVVPHHSSLSSQAANWEPLQLEHHIQPAHEMPEYRATQHLLVLTHAQQTATVERRFEGAFREERTQQGSVAIIPAHTAHQVRWNSNVEFTVLALEPRWTARVAYESIEPDQIEVIPHFFQPDPLIHAIAVALKMALEAKSASRLYVEASATLLAAHMLQQYAARQPRQPFKQRQLSPKQLQRVIDYIQSHLTQDLKLAELAMVAGFSCYYFARLFKQATGHAPHQYILHQRLERAKHLLLTTNLTIAQIAYSVGFANQSHLSSHFKRQFKLTPGQLRKL